MRTAAINIDVVDGYGFRARSYKLIPPLPDPGTGKEHSYVTIGVQDGNREHQLPQTVVFASSPENGMALGPSMKRLAGSFSFAGDPDDPNYHEGAFSLALMVMDVSAVVPLEELPDSNPGPEPEFPEGLDYDPDDLPEE